MADLYADYAPRLMADLMSAFPTTLRELDAAAIVGNAGHESNGFRTLQEVRPTVTGSRGGWGFFQWTGPRRLAFEAWAKKERLKPESYAANSGFLIRELQTTERQAIAALARGRTLEEKVIAFERAYERAGVKHYDSRLRWAKRALDLYSGGPANPKPLTRSRTAGGVAAAAAGTVPVVAAGVEAASRLSAVVDKAQTAVDKAQAAKETAENALTLFGGVPLSWALWAGAALIVAGLAAALYARWSDGGHALPLWLGRRLGRE